MAGKTGVRNLQGMRGRRKGGLTTYSPALPPGDLGGLAARFLQRMEARCRSASTIETHRWALKYFLQWAAARRLDSPAAFTRPLLEEYQLDLFRYRSPRTGAPLAINTQLVRLGVIRRFFAWLCRESLIPANPASDLDLPRKQPRRLPKSLAESEIHRLLALPDTASPFGLRDRTILELFYATGIRRTEMVRLDAGDYDPAAGTLHVRLGKGGKSRLLPVGRRAARWLDRYLAEARPLLAHLPSETSLFLSGYGTRLSSAYLGNWVAGLLKKAGIEKQGSCHLFRHSCATHMLEGGADIRYIQQMLGHARLDTTQIYTEVSIRALSEVHARCHPHGRPEESDGDTPSPGETPPLPPSHPPENPPLSDITVPAPATTPALEEAIPSGTCGKLRTPDDPPEDDGPSPSCTIFGPPSGPIKGGPSNLHKILEINRFFDPQHPRVHYYGSKYYETPNIDRLAAEGLKFTDGYTNGPNCQPTRAALISGQYAARTGVYTVGGIDRFDWRSQALRPVDNVTALPADKITIAQSLKKAGYATGHFGKWHLGNKPAEHPSRRGFDEAIVSNGKHFDFPTSPKTAYPEGTYLADFLTDKAVDFIERHKDRPFFLYLPHFGVHSPYEAKPELIAKFKNKPAAAGHRDPVYAAMIASVDESVGRIAAKLDELGLAENTLVIFTSDNGGVGGYRREGIQARDITDNAPLRGGKGTLHEGGIRVPYIFRWKGTIPAKTVSSQPIASIDFYPSALELAGAPSPENHPLDGVSYASHLKHPADTALDRDALHWHFPGYLGSARNTWRTKPVSAIRSGPWKLIQSLEDLSLQLYNLTDDIGEKTNLAESRPEKAAELLAKLDAWRKDIKAPLPTPNTPSGKNPPEAKEPRNATRQ